MKLKHSVWGERLIQLKDEGPRMVTRGWRSGPRPVLKQREPGQSVSHEAQPG